MRAAVLGGITRDVVDMQNKGIFQTLLDIQGFGLDVVKSIATNPDHVGISSSFYANPFNSRCVVNPLDCVILGATEIHTDCNVNVTTGSTGLVIGGAGGHSDAAAGSALTIIAAKLMHGEFRTGVDTGVTVTTPRETVDVLLTDHGIACQSPAAGSPGPTLRREHIDQGHPRTPAHFGFFGRCAQTRRAARARAGGRRIPRLNRYRCNPPSRRMNRIALLYAGNPKTEMASRGSGVFGHLRR